jgi:putative oxidoreductase
VADRRDGTEDRTPDPEVSAVNRLIQLVIAPRDLGRAAWAVAAARVAAGVVFVAFSFGKFIHHEAEAAAFDRYGIPQADAATYLVGTLELVGGLMLVLGLGTRVVAVALAGNMIGAIATAGRHDGGPVNLGLAPAVLAAMLVLIWAGAGRASLDEMLARRWTSRRSGRGGGSAGPSDVEPRSDERTPAGRP